MNGVIVIDKPEGFTSFDVIAVVRKLTKQRKTGHTGTLDPNATGVLPVLLGSATKAQDLIVNHDKEYRADFRLGLTTDTLDIWGRETARFDSRVTRVQIEALLPQFTGEIRQIPPMYSALKVGGEKLVDLARKGIEIPRESRQITVKSISAQYISDNDYALNVTCSKGTYIRTLCADIGKSLGCGGAMASLRRLKSGSFSIENAHTIEKLEGLSYEERVRLLMPTEEVFAQFPSYKPEGFFLKLCRDGQQLYQKKIKTDFPCGSYVRLYDDGGFFALARVDTFEGETALKPVKVFRLK